MFSKGSHLIFSLINRVLPSKLAYRAIILNQSGENLLIRCPGHDWGFIDLQARCQGADLFAEAASVKGTGTMSFGLRKAQIPQ
jgi:hypothetical protein